MEEYEIVRKTALDELVDLLRDYLEEVFVKNFIKVKNVDPEDCIDIIEASKVLNISILQLIWITKRGTIKIYEHNDDVFYSKKEVQGLKDWIEDFKTEFPKN